MEIVKVTEKQLKLLTEFIIESSLIFHPTISPNGIPNFSDHLNKEYVLIIDRNIMTNIVQLCSTGILKDALILKKVSSLLFWAHINKIAITGGMALNEYANILCSDSEASKENNIFKRMFDQYPIITWLELFEGSKTRIPKIELINKEKTNFNITSSHHYLHLAEIFQIANLSVNDGYSPTKKMITFLQWINENIIFCSYTVVYAALLFSKRIKQLKVQTCNNIDQLKKICSNQAWDLTYLSTWSTLYWDENLGNTRFLFATMDKDLKKVFVNTHTTQNNLFIRCFGEKEGKIINEEYEKIIGDRKKTKITEEGINNLIEKELRNLIFTLKLN